MTSPDPLEGTEQPFVAHLVELRDRLMRALYGLLVAMVALFVVPKLMGLGWGTSFLIDSLAAPIRAHMPATERLIAVGVMSPVLVPLKVLLMASILLCLPWLLYQAWAFIAPGLYQHEKRFALPLILMGSLLAYIGIGFVQFVVLDSMFAFIQAATPASVAATPDVASYVETILGLYIAFSLTFQVPIVVILLVKVGLITLEKLKAFRGYFVVLAFVIAAVVTPPDVISQLALAVPMCLLYELGIWASSWMVKPKPEDPDDAPAPTPSP